MSFQDLNLTKPLLNALDEMGYTQPTTIQRKAFSVIMSGQDVCGIAQTGTGKTVAYLLPCLRMMKYAKDRFPQMLVIVPTRELVIQVVATVEQLCKYQNFTAVALYGGVNMKPQAAAVENGCDIIVATPGRLLDIILTGALKTKNIKKLVIDEVDEMLNLGFRSQLIRVMDLLPARRQNLLFSATITEDVEALMNTFFNAPTRVEAAPNGTPLESINQSFYAVPNFYTKVNLLELLLSNDETMTKVLVFAATKSLADQLYEQLSERFPNIVGVIHSNKEQNYRFNAVKQFTEGNFHILIATDLVARGIDIAEVSHVINFDTPDAPENYIHRIGRTGRADKEGIAITFVTEKEQEQFAAIEALMNYTVPEQELPEDLEISQELTDDEKPKVQMREISAIFVPQDISESKAFHEKSAKNKKVNAKVSHKEKMQQKYGKPKSRGKKR